MAEEPTNDSNEMSGVDESSVVYGGRRSWPGPRTVVVPKADDAFGFTLRHLVIQPPEKTSSVDAVALEGDDDCIEDQALAGERSGSSGSGLPMETIFVKQVKQDSQAHSAGLRTGDRIVSINGVNVAGKTYSQVIRLMHGSDSALTLMVIPKDEDVLQMAYKTSDDGGKEIPGRNPSVLSTCHVSVSPATNRRGQEHCSRNSASTSSQASNLEGRFLAEQEYRSGSPSLHIRVHINPSGAQNRHSDSAASNVSQPATFNSREPTGDVWISGGSLFYPVTTTARKTKPEDYVLSTEHLSVGRDAQRDALRDALTAAKLRTSPLSALTSEADNSASSEYQRSSFTYNLTPLQPTDACTLRQSPKLTSYREITLSQLGDCSSSSTAPQPLSVQQMVVPRASAQESSRLSSHFIHMAPPAGPHGVSMHLDVGNPVVVNSMSTPKSSASVVGARQQMFVSARPQSYESLFGHGRVEQVPPVSCTLGAAASKSSSALMDKSSLSPRQPAAVTAASLMPRLSTAVDQPRVSLVTERMRRFESGDNADESRNARSSKLRDEELSAIGGCPQFGYDSVAKRAAQFEQISTEDARQAPADAHGRRNILDSLKVYKAPASLDQSKELWSSPASPSPIGSRQVPPSVTIPLYFRADPSTSVSKSTSPSLNHHGEAVPSGSSVDGTSSESGGGPLAVVAVSSQPGSAEKKVGIHSQEMQVTAKVGCRQSAGHPEKTGVDKTADGSCAMTVESISQSTTLAMAATLGIKEQLFGGEAFEPPSSPALINAPAKSGNSNIKKFVAFFTDKKAVDPGVDKKSAGEATLTSGNVTIEGCLNCKAAVADGKKASDRSWKPFWAVLRGHFLGLYKDRYSLTSGLSEEQSVCVKSSSVEVAVEYVKKRNVFQVTTASGSKFLFQTEDPESMSNWVKAIQANSESKETQEPSTSAMTLGQNLQRAVTMEKTSPQVAPKAKKQSSKIIPVSKSPASPLSKTRKAGFSVTDSVESPRVKEHKTWKGKMVKKFGRHRSGSGATVEMSDDQELTGTFGVPLDACPPSLFNECVPLIVETCTRIVEERGIENQGIYRVPGNSCAVNTLRDELNKFPENIDAECDKWQDVNVVSSLLKLFFRKLPDSLITDELYEPVITAYRLQNPEKKMLKLKKLLHDLPEHNFETFRFLAQHLNRVASREDINKMDARNLAIVFGPTLVRPQDQSVVLMVKDMSDQCRVVETIIVNVDWFFSSWDEDVNVPLAEENEPISSINSELLAKAENLMNPTEMTRDLSAKDLVSSILHAANKKIRRKDRNKSAESIETEGESDVSYSDRNIDQEMEIQGMREFLESGSHHLAFATTSSSTVVSSSPATPAGCSSSISLETAKTQQTVAIKTSTEKGATKPSTVQARSALDVKRYPAYHFDPVGTTAETENSKPKILRRYSEDAFGITTAAEHDEVTLRPFMRDGSLVEHAEQQLRRLHHDTRALYHKQELERMEREKRASAKERVEREFSKTIQELELEEAESNSPSKLSSDAATSSADGSSVRSAMDRCKLAMYENRLRFFTDFGDRKAFSPVFRQGTATQSSSSASVSPLPLTRRLSDQPSDSSLRREDDCLLAAAPPTRAHSVSPSIIGRETRYGFDVVDKNSESSKFSREPSSSVKRFDRSLAVVSENQSSSDLAAGQLLAVGQPLVMPSPTRCSSKGLSTSSVSSSLAVSFGTDSSTTRSSTASFSGDGSSDLSAKDSVFPEKTPSESEQTLPGDVTDITHKFRTSYIRDESGTCAVEDDGRKDSPVFMPASQFSAIGSQVNNNVEMNAKSPENSLEQPTQRDELSEEITAENHRFLTEVDASSSSRETRALVSTMEASGKPGDFLSDYKAALSPPSNISSVEMVDNTETTTFTESRTSEGNVSELEQKEPDAQQLWPSKDNEAKVQFESGCPTSKSASYDVSLVQSLPSTSENGCLDQTGALNGLGQDGHYGDVLSNGNLNQTSVFLAANEGITQTNEAAVETGSKSVRQSGTSVFEATTQVLANYSESMAQSPSVQKAGTQSVSTDCQGLALSSSVQSETSTQSTSIQRTAVTQSVSVQSETVTQSSSTESKAVKQSANSEVVAMKQLSSLESEDIARSHIEHPTVVTQSADVQQSALILSQSSALPPAFSRTFTHLDDCGASILKQRHSICSSSVRDYLQGTKKTLDSNDGKLRRSESRDLVKLHRTASLPLLPCP